MDAALIDAVFGLRCDIIPDPLYGTPLCIPHGKGRMAPPIAPAALAGTV